MSPERSVETIGAWCGKTVITPAVVGMVADTAGPSKRVSPTLAITRWNVLPSLAILGLYLSNAALHVKGLFPFCVVFAFENFCERADRICERNVLSLGAGEGLRH